MSVIELGQDNFESTVSEDGIVIVDFWAPWCGPCRAFAPIFEKTSKAHPDITFAKVNTEDNRELGSALQIRSIPTLMIFKDGIMVFNQAGMVPAKALNNVIEQVEGLDMDEVRKKIEDSKTQQSKSA